MFSQVSVQRGRGLVKARWCRWGVVKVACGERGVVKDACGERECGEWDVEQRVVKSEHPFPGTEVVHWNAFLLKW